VLKGVNTSGAEGSPANDHTESQYFLTFFYFPQVLIAVMSFVFAVVGWMYVVDATAITNLETDRAKAKQFFFVCPTFLPANLSPSSCQLLVGACAVTLGAVLFLAGVSYHSGITAKLVDSARSEDESNRDLFASTTVPLLNSIQIRCRAHEPPTTQSPIVLLSSKSFRFVGEPSLLQWHPLFTNVSEAITSDKRFVPVYCSLWKRGADSGSSLPIFTTQVTVEVVQLARAALYPSAAERLFQASLLSFRIERYLPSGSVEPLWRVVLNSTEPPYAPLGNYRLTSVTADTPLTLPPMSFPFVLYKQLSVDAIQPSWVPPVSVEIAHSSDPVILRFALCDRVGWGDGCSFEDVKSRISQLAKATAFAVPGLFVLILSCWWLVHMVRKVRRNSKQASLVPMVPVQPDSAD